MNTLKAPFAWIGGKSKLAKEIIALMPEHKTYIEVFGGALSVFYQKQPSKVEVVNDINDDLINLHLCIKNRPQSLMNYLNTMIPSRKIFYMIKNKEILPGNDIERAAFFYYLICNSFGSDTKWIAASKTRRPTKLIRNFDKHSQRLKNTFIECKNYDYILKHYDYEDALFYLDPPYVGTEKYYTTNFGFNEKDHEKLFNLLKSIKGKFILSYNNNPLINELYKNFNIINTNTNYTLNSEHFKKDSKELIITNF